MSKTSLAFDYVEFKKEFQKLALEKYPNASIGKEVCYEAQFLLPLLKQMTNYVFDDKMWEFLDYFQKYPFSVTINLKCVCGVCRRFNNTCKWCSSYLKYLQHQVGLYYYIMSKFEPPKYILTTTFPSTPIESDNPSFHQTATAITSFHQTPAAIASLHPTPSPNPTPTNVENSAKQFADMEKIV